MTDPLQFLNAPLGQPGSGRVRYGAAMELWRQGRISPDVLEVYRVASAHDARDPGQILAEQGLRPLETFMTETPLNTLYGVARDYVLTLDHPGAAEVRAGLPADPGPAQVMLWQENAVVSAWLDPALELVAKDQPDLAVALRAAMGDLKWITYDAYPRDEIGDDFANGHAYAAIMGGDAPFQRQDFELGLFLIAPHTLYRDHHHAAPELYAPLTGPHGWRFGTGRPLILKPAHQPVWNPAHQPHLTKVGAAPFLCLWVWTRDVNEIAQVIPADDWPELEVLRLA